jgi:MFS family permease
VAKEPVTRTFMLISFILPLFTTPIVTILPPIYTVKVFHSKADVLGIIMASIGVGGIFGGIITASLSRFERRGLVQLASLFLLSVSLIGFAFSTTLWVALPLLGIAGFFEAICMTTNQTLLQLSIPDYLRGRVTSIMQLSVGLSLLGGLLAGVGSDLLGGPKMITIVLAGIAATLAVFIFFTSSTVRNYRLSKGIAVNSTKPPEGVS